MSGNGGTIMLAIPKTKDDLSIAWLSSVLNRTVTGFETQFLEGGVLSDAYKLTGITYAGGGADAPESLVVKIANQIKELRDFGMLANAYNKELRLYRDLSAELPVRAPKLYGCETDGSAGAEFFYILMEDLTAHSKVFDQVDDPPDAAFSRKLALDIVALHAKYWQSELLRDPWIGAADGSYKFSLDGYARMAGSAWGTFRELYLRMFGYDLFAEAPYDGGDFAVVEELTNLLCGPQSAAIVDRIAAVLSSRPKTLLHGDLRADNVFRTDPEFGKSVDESQLTYIDWQILHAGPPGVEFSQAWYGSLEPDVRPADVAILREYHNRLVSLNPKAAAYTYDMLLEDYALGCIYWWMAMIPLGAAAFLSFDKPEGARSKQLWGRGIYRVLHTLRDRDCLGVVRRVAADIL